MKKLEKIFSLLVIAITLYACNTDDSEAITASGEAGVTVNINETQGKILGLPAPGVDLADAEIEFTAVELDFDAKLQSGNENLIQQYEIIKTYNDGDEVVVATTSNMPYTFTFETIEEFVSGFNITPEEIRIGDEFKFIVKVLKTNGSEYYFGDRIAAYTIIVNCSSDLAGMYHVTTTRGDGAVWDQGIEEIVEVSAGYYKTITTGGWPAGSIAPDQGFNFQDTCNTLTVPDQGLAQGYYSNDVKGNGNGEVLANGDLVIYYTISFSTGDSEYYNTYVKQ